MKFKIRTLLFTVSILFMGTGIYRGEVQKVLIKAINICLECIGIG